MKVFLTGIGGLLGGAVAGALLDAGHEVTGLVRSSRAVRDMDGRDRSGEVTLLPGNVTADNCGLAASPPNIDLVVHCAAVTGFDAGEAVHDAANVIGTRNVTRLAWRCGAPLIHVSTAYVCGTRDGWIAESHCDPTGRFTNSYEASKASAEAELRAQMADVMPIAIVRPSVILGRYSDGAIPTVDNFYHMFRLIGSGATGPVPVANGAAFNFVPIDHVVNGIVYIAQHFAAFADKLVHLTAPNAVLMADLVAAMRHYPGARPAALVDPADFDAAMLNRRQALIHRKVGQLYFGYFLRAPQFEAKALVAGGGPQSPVMDEAALLRMIDFCVESGFVDWGERI